MIIDDYMLIVTFYTDYKDYISNYEDDLLSFSYIVLISLKLVSLYFINDLKTEAQTNITRKVMSHKIHLD